MSVLGTEKFKVYTHENRGRVLLLFLLFLLAIYQLTTTGITGLAMVCAIPIVLLYVVIALKYKMFTFWTLFIVNYFVMFLNRYQYMPIPSSLPNELLEIILIAIAIIDIKELSLSRFTNAMFIALIAWCGFCTIEMFNDTCGLGFNIGAWYTGARLMAFQLMYAFIVCSIYIADPKRINAFLRMWAILSIFAAFWAWKQQNIGFTDIEKSWLVYAGRTHIVNGIIRYFSVFSDAANFGCNMAGSAIVFYVTALTNKIRRERIFYLIAALCCTWALFASGTRTAIFCFIGGMMVYLVLSKSVKILFSVGSLFAVFIVLLAFTNIGNGNSMIRRMRSGFNRNDASLNVRDINKEAISKYIQDAPWGIGVGMGYENVPANNKYRKLSTIPPDSEYVFIWVHTGPIGITIFVITTVVMLFGACWIVMFRLKNKALIGIGGGICGAFAAIQVGGYANQILMQFPNVLLFYGSLAVVYTLPLIEKEYDKYEEEKLHEQEQKKLLKDKKKQKA
ncbi:MAG: O-antigen ligase family protein [Prevotella sp.]|nr:O-antigen ligase family protein [Prevotella sp.]